MKKVIIIGAGILGATAAYKLAKQNIQVTIMDGNHAGEATDAAAGIICPWLSQRRNKKWYELAKGGARVYPTLVQELEEDGETETGYSRVGAISIREDEEKLLAMKERAIQRREDAPEIGEVSILNQEETQKIFPLVDAKFSSVHISGAGRVDGRSMKHALISAAQKHGAKVVRGNATLQYAGHEITGVKVGNETLEADTVIATSGAWMNELLDPLGISFQGTFQKGQLLHLQVPNIDTSKWPLLMPPSDQSIVPFDNHIVIGATHEDDTGMDQRLTAGGVHELLSKALKFAPGLADSTILEARVGFRPFTPGFLPVFGTLPGFKGLLLANGLGASGLTTGPYVGMQLAKLVLNQSLDVDISDYDVSIALK